MFHVERRALGPARLCGGLTRSPSARRPFVERGSVAGDERASLFDSYQDIVHFELNPRGVSATSFSSECRTACARNGHLDHYGAPGRHPRAAMARLSMIVTRRSNGTDCSARDGVAKVRPERPDSPADRDHRIRRLCSGHWCLSYRSYPLGIGLSDLDAGNGTVHSTEGHRSVRSSLS